ncbi:hypothetical protein Tco_0180957 [Tanacetum coccineum]
MYPTARDRQKSYANVRRKPLEFQIGDKVLLKVSPWKGVIRFGKRGKLNPRYIGPFKIVDKVGTVAYRRELPEQLSRVHSMFHVSNLKKCMVDEPLAIPLDEIQIDDKLHFIEEPVKIMDREVKRLKQSRIPIFKVRWNSIRDLEFTWECEDQMQKKYPHLFPISAPVAETTSCLAWTLLLGLCEVYLPESVALQASGALRTSIHGSLHRGQLLIPNGRPLRLTSYWAWIHMIVHRSSAIFERPSHDSSSASLSRKRSRSLVAYVPLSSPTLGALSYVRADLLPSSKRIRSPETAMDLKGCSEDRADGFSLTQGSGKEIAQMYSLMRREDVEVSIRLWERVVQRFHDHTEEILVHRVQLERDNRRLRDIVDVESQRVTRFRCSELRVQRELRQIRRFRFYDRMRIARLEACARRHLGCLDDKSVLSKKRLPEDGDRVVELGCERSKQPELNDSMKHFGLLDVYKWYQSHGALDLGFFTSSLEARGSVSKHFRIVQDTWRVLVWDVIEAIKTDVKSKKPGCGVDKLVSCRRLVACCFCTVLGLVTYLVTIMTLDNCKVPILMLSTSSYTKRRFPSISIGGSISSEGSCLLFCCDGYHVRAMLMLPPSVRLRGRGSLGPVFLLGLSAFAMVAACASRAAVKSAISCRRASKVMAGVSDVDVLLGGILIIML